MITYILIGVTIGIFFALTDKSFTEAKINIDGMKVMCPSKGYEALSWIVSVFFTIIGLLFAFGYQLNIPKFPKPEMSDGIGIMMMLVAIYTMAVYLILYERNSRTMYNDIKIISRNIFGKTKELAWKDIVNVTFSKSSLGFYIKTKEHKISVHKHLSGFNDFTNKVKTILEPELTKQALVDLSETDGR